MSKKYNIIYADPAWSYDFKEPTASKGGAKGSGYSAGVNYYYGTMTTKQILELPVKNICGKGCVLFLWATNPLLPEALETMKAWGFKYKTMITWHKERCKGMGYWFRGHTEHILVGVKGNVKAFRSLEHNIKKLPVEKHSKKPDEFRKMIDAVSFGNKIELFAREKHEGWDCWGNEVESSVAL
jgi:N6-adenosine-specific RNA methylase IME4